MTQGHGRNNSPDPLEQDIRTLFREESAGINPNEGLDRFMAAVAAHPRARASWWTRLNRWLANVGFTPALASTVVMLQVGVIAALLALQVQPEKEDVLDMTPRGVDVLQQEAPDFKLTVKPDTRFSELVTLLRGNHCRIVAGPSELGEIWVVVDDDAKFEEIRTALTQSALIDEVVVNR
jgi:hypothetical protein